MLFTSAVADLGGGRVGGSDPPSALEFKKLLIAIADWLLQYKQYAHECKLKPPLHKKSRSAPVLSYQDGTFKFYSTV